MKKTIKWIGVLFLILVVSIVALVYIYGPNYNLYLVPPTPKKYGELALNKMDQIGLYANSNEWATKKEEIQTKLLNVTSYEEAVPLLEEALKIAGGKHSFILTGEELNKVNSDEFILPTVKEIDNSLILTIPPFSGNAEQAQKYANTLADPLINSSYTSIILDFRDNSGGDLGPMISGLSSLLPEGNLLNFVDRDNMKTPLTLENGSVINGGTKVTMENHKKITDIPIAILINDRTGSSGEITALCFKGIHNVTFLGTETAGYTSSNIQINLYDGSVMQITNAAIEDRKGTSYSNVPILPDIHSEDPMLDAKSLINKK